MSRCRCTSARIFSFLKSFYEEPIPHNIERIGSCTLVIFDSAFHKINTPGVIAVDFDETICASLESSQQEKIILKNHEQWFTLLSYAKQKNFKIVLVTARTYSFEKDWPYYERVDEALNLFSKDERIFSAIYFTNLKSGYPANKSLALLDLNKRTYSGAKKDHAKIILFDDLGYYLQEVQQYGFGIGDGNRPEMLEPFIRARGVPKEEKKNTKTNLPKESIPLHSLGKLSPF
jgi:hypothetical protein